ncbi:D-alanyl-D-alanine carboxypeptidase [Ureibacillus manganicus DSM 26584]|uniref:D-alanyl-D-alanine carboxypeptidase n=2 Tax=Ureibacillus TaxID=160795 RepID=A0A0A3ILZ8_9BACL|nr:D-alanyl-D-alanine carboxypeptidase [Ureibacillus manganicus DSM 26584]
MSKKTNTTLSIITIVLLVLAIIAIVFITINKNENSHEEVQKEEMEEKEPVKADPKTEENLEPEKGEDNTNPTNSNERDENKEEQKEEEDKDNKDVSNSTTNEASKDDNGYIVGQTLPTEPTFIKGVLIANKKYPLPKDYNPGEDAEALAALNDMSEAARNAGFELTAFSTFRSFDYQSNLYNRYVTRDGKDNADRYSARPGYSEHQTGLAFDIGEVGREDVWLTSEFGETEAGKWLVENAHKYGFILRYPKGKENITGYMYESWHFRYLGIPLATEVKESELTLEEFLGIE